jgi:hypothetical protein
VLLNIRTKDFYHSISPVILLPCLLACSVQFVSLYDQPTEQLLSDIHRKVETFLVKLESQAGSPEATYVNNKDFYHSMNVEISALKVRAEAMPGNNTRTVEQIGILDHQIGDLRRLHESRGDRGLNDVMISSTRTAINATITSLLALEIAKKRERIKVKDVEE